MNFNKFGRKVLLGLVSLVVVLSCVKLGARAEGETGILYLNNEAITSFRQDGNYTYPTKSGYVFGGWYNDAEGKDPMTEEEANNATTAYVKWVPDYVLSVKAQVNKAALDDNITTTSKAAIRLLTSVDSRDYKSVGFDVVRGDYPSYTYHLDSKNVYTRVRVVGETEGTYTEHTPEDVFGSDSHFFEAVTFKNVPETAVNTELSVTPYWVTPDGTRVNGAISIKTVNLGRSWVYVSETANTDDSLQFGTYNHPFEELGDALDSVLLENNGKVIAKGNNLITVSDTFEWTEHTVTVGDAEKKCNITITGEDASAGFDFSAFKPLYINDNVVFDNMTLELAENAYVYANGNKFVITSTVTSDNGSTTIFGGGNNATLTSGTNIEIHAGNYYMIFGGNKDGGSITGDIHVTVTNANVFNADEADKNRVFGGGWGTSTVNGDIYVTVGQGFNKDYSQSVSNYGIAGGDHKRRSAVFGAGAGGEVVKGSTYVTIKDDAKVDFVYGGGTASSGIVEGTCHVTLQGGTVFSIYGGAQGDTAVTDATEYRNRDTSVVVEGGEVWQIMGGNGSGMAGNTYVEISGGQVHRRIYGGCYSDTEYVDGHTTVVINKSDSLAFDTIYTEKLYAGSQNTGNTEEIKTLIFNDTYDEDKLCSSKDYNYLVQANEGGVVSSIGTRLSVTPNDENNAIVRLDNDTTGTLHAYMTSKGMCALPELNTNTSKREVYVVFGTEQLDAETLSGYEAKVGGTHFDTLENAIAEAKALSTADETAVVTLLKDVEVDSVLSVNGSHNITVQSEGNNQYTIKVSYTDENVFSVYGTLTINNVAIVGGNHGIYVGSGGKLDSTEIVNTEGVSISGTGSRGLFVDGGTVDMYNLSVSTTTQQALLFQKGAKATISKYNVVGTSGQVAVRILGGADVTLNNGTVYANNGYGIYMSDDSSKVQATDTKVIRTTGTNALVGIAHSTAQLIFNQSESGEAYIDGQSYEGLGVDVIKGTFILNGGTIRNNSATSGAGVTVQKDATFIMNGGTISNNTTTEYGAGVCALGSFTMNAGEISDNIATAQGGGVYVTASTFTMTGGTICDNTATNGGGVYVPESSIFTMQSGTISGNKATDTTSGGGGVYVAANGTFNMNAPGKEGATPGVIKENVATKYGAGVLVYGTFNMNAGTITNHGSEETPLNAEGAGVCLIGTSATFVMEGGQISNNCASSAGVGVSMRGGDATHPVFTMNGGSIIENHASNNVGGIVVRSGVFTMNEGAVISNNTAEKLAGGMSLEGSKTTFVLNGGLLTNNSSGTGGNDIYLAGRITLTKALTSNISIGPSSYSETKVIAQKGDGISDEEFKTSMKLLDIEDKDGHWFTNDEGILKKGPVVLQSTGVGYATLSDAVAAASEGDTITILRSEEIASTLMITKDLTITSDKAVTISANSDMAADMLNVGDGKALTITGASEDAKISFVGNTKVPNVIHSLGTTQLTNVNITSGKIGVYIPSGGSVVANNILIQKSTDKGLSVQAGASVTATGITVKDTTNQGLYFTGKSGQVATANIFDFEVSGTGKAAIRPMSYCDVTLNSGTITVANVEGIATGKNNTLNITNVEVYAPQDRITNMKVLYVNDAYVANDYFGDKVTVSVKEQ